MGDYLWVILLFIMVIIIAFCGYYAYKVFMDYKPFESGYVLDEKTSHIDKPESTYKSKPHHMRIKNLSYHFADSNLQNKLDNIHNKDGIYYILSGGKRTRLYTDRFGYFYVDKDLKIPYTTDYSMDEDTSSSAPRINKRDTYSNKDGTKYLDKHGKYKITQNIDGSYYVLENGEKIHLFEDADGYFYTDKDLKIPYVIYHSMFGGSR